LIYRCTTCNEEVTVTQGTEDETGPEARR